MDQLKDVILSTLAEIQETLPQEETPEKKRSTKSDAQSESEKKIPEAAHKKPKKETFFSDVTQKRQISSESELLFLQSLRERLLVLFEGFQAPNNTAIEAKIDLTLNFLEYVLASIDTRIEQIKGR